MNSKLHSSLDLELQSRISQQVPNTYGLLAGWTVWG